MTIRRVCVYCASSEQADQEYRQAAQRLGEVLAEQKITIAYGGGGMGSMGSLAAGALSRGGEVIGVVPRFMQELKWSHTGLSQMLLVENMRERKHLMLAETDAVIALPGGCGTLEELFEAITLKRLGIYLNPIVLINTRNFFHHFTALMTHCIAERFMDTRHAAMWQVVAQPEQVLDAIRHAPQWSTAALQFAALTGDGQEPSEPS